MPVNTTHADYDAALARYKLVRDIINNDAMKHIRHPEPENKYSLRNKEYREAAVLTNFTNLTCDGLTGLVFRNKLKLELPPELSYLEYDVSGTGVNVYQFSQHITSEMLQVGRFGFLVDYYVDGGRAYIKPYCAESIINWKTKRVDGVVQLSLLVLEENISLDSDDVFSQDTQVQYRVLRLDESGEYIQEIYSEDLQYKESIEVQDYNGNKFGYIPFVFIGSENNDWNVDKLPLYDLAVLNLAHYRNSADEEESIFINGQPYLVIDPGESGAEEFREANPQGVAYGSRTVLVLGSGGKPVLLQANPNQMVSAAMDKKLEQAAKIGARLIEPGGGRETAEAARIRYGAQHSSLYTLTANIEWAIVNALRTVCEFMGANNDLIHYELNKDFYDEAADPNLIAQQIMLLKEGVTSKEEIREYEERTNVIKDAEADYIIEEAPAVTEVKTFPEEILNE